MATIRLVPRGEPDQGAQWSNPQGFMVRVVQETQEAWITDKALTYPKFAWQLA